ncbi:acyl-CoA synthetase [Hazenella coriacea]|uniref:Fatty-acyl-CoA synthase n=1 Tax=Hazenella coriacea TaxID=1179467 RepID=A0A4R3L348_9BACL|nr:long-chain fatty acid--CoA ligase [Hazenella coriacea]TCS93919.1 fatty-acyl-CoA synthase [Hazenella coriacea]
MSITVDWISSRDRLTPTQVAVVDAENGQRWTYQEMNQRAKSLAAFFRQQGIGKGDRIALFSPNDVSYFDVLFACAKIGAIFVPFNWRLSVRELIGIVEDCAPKLLIYHRQYESLAIQLPIETKWSLEQLHHTYLEETISLPIQFDILPTDPWMILYTGGTTGKPKGAVLTHESVYWNAINTVLTWDLSSVDVTPVYMPMFHTGALNALSIPILYAGGTVVIARRFLVDDVYDVIQREQCTIILMVPTMYHLFIQSSRFAATSFPTMRVFLSGGAPCPHVIYDAFQAKGIAFKEGYGLTEAGPNNFQIEPEIASQKKGSVGLPMFFNEIQLVSNGKVIEGSNQVGELWLKGGHLFTEYWKNPQATDEVWHDQWFRTGDLGKRDADGYYYIVGREKDMIVTGGENVYPLEVELVLSEHPEVEEISVVGIPDAHWGEIVAAAIVPVRGKKIEIEDLDGFCSKKLGRYKVPKKFIFLDELPKTMVGKIDKKGIVRMYGQ